MLTLFLFPLLAFGIGMAIFGDGSGGGSDNTADDTVDDTLVTVGDEGDNIIEAGNGNDRVFAMGGDDLVVGGAGDDTLFLGDGMDMTISPEEFADAEFSLFYPVEGSAALIDFAGDAGNDSIYGGAQPDILIDFEGSNALYGGLGNDSIAAFDGGIADNADLLFGGYGDDVLLGDRGDSMTGGTGSDIFGIYVAKDDATPVTIEDFAQNDYISIISDIAGPDSILSTEAATDGSGLFITLDSQTVAFVKGIDSLSPDQYSFLGLSTEPLMIKGTASDDLLVGGAGNDLIYADAGADLVFGGGGDNVIFLGDGDDTAYGDQENSLTSNDYIDGGAGNDLIYGGEGNDELHGSLGNDTLNDNLGSNQLFGGFGADVLGGVDYDGFSPDILDGGAGDDFLFGDNGDTMTGGTGSDHFVNDVLGDAGSDPITVTDFSTTEDTLIVFSPNGTPISGFSLALSGDGTSTEVTSEGEVRAILQGLTPAQLVGADIRMLSA